MAVVVLSRRLAGVARRTASGRWLRGGLLTAGVLLVLVAIAQSASAGGTGQEIVTDSPSDGSSGGITGEIVRLSASADASNIYYYVKVASTDGVTPPNPPQYITFNVDMRVANVEYYVAADYQPAGTWTDTLLWHGNSFTGGSLGNPITAKWVCNEALFTIPRDTFDLPPSDGTAVDELMATTWNPDVGAIYDTAGGSPPLDSYPGSGKWTIGPSTNLLQDPPTGVTATATGDNEVTVTWVAAPDTGAQPTTFYKIYRSTDGVTFTSVGQTSTTETTWKDTTAPVSDAQVESTSLASYAYQVSAVNCPDLPGGGESALSIASAPITPDFRPDAPVWGATGKTSTTISLSWTAPADRPTGGGTAIAGYRLYRFDTDPGAACDAAEIAAGTPVTVAGTALSVVDTGLSEETDYWYCIQASDRYPAGPNRSPFSLPFKVTTDPPADPTLPTIVSVSPESGPETGGTSVTLTGTNFATTGTVAVKFGATSATSVTVVSSTKITAVTPAGSAGAVDVVVTNPDGQVATKTGGFTYTVTAAPAVTKVNPTAGGVVGGTVVTVTGTGFATTGTVAVTFGSTAGTSVTVASATSLTVTTPAHAAGPVSVAVTNPDGQSASLPDAFTYIAPPPPPPSTAAPLPPLVADAGPMQIVQAGEAVTLDGQGGTASSAGVFEWTQWDGPAVGLSGADASVATFQAPRVTADTVLRFGYRIGDGTRWSDPAAVLVMVRALDQAPVADGGPDRTVAAGDRVVLDGSLSHDPDGDPLDLAWSQVGGPAVVFTVDALWGRASFTAPSATEGQDTVLEFQLDASARGLAGTPDRVLVTVPALVPPLVPAVEVVVSPTDPALVSFQGPDFTDAVEYRWDFGDGQTETGNAVQHQYAESGIYDVVLEVTRTSGVTRLGAEAVVAGPAETQEAPEPQEFSSAPGGGVSRTTGLIASGATVAVVGAAAAAIILWTRRTPPTA